MERADARKITMRLLDDASIPEFRAVTAREVAETRHKMGLSQPVLAKYLGVSPSIVAKWERGAAVPSRSAQYVLRLVGRRGLSALGELSQSPSPPKRRRSG